MFDVTYLNVHSLPKEIDKLKNYLTVDVILNFETFPSYRCIEVSPNSELHFILS